MLGRRRGGVKVRYNPCVIRSAAPFLLAAVVMAVFFSASRVIDTKLVHSEESGAWIYVRMSLLWAAVVFPIMPLFFWALRAVYVAAGERLWAMPIMMFAMSNIASAIVFWAMNNEAPSRGTLAGLGLSTAAMLCCLWR